ncbi:bifunctional UDP-N-acetylglucosamine diphosphorylase/glucosamine-1-phosphate N-acetyltransferase GlmU [soil metagenome]
MQNARKTAIIVLAAGQGTRMRSGLPKVLHKAGGRSLLGHVMAAAQSVAPDRAVLVAGPDMDAAAAEARRYGGDTAVAIQEKRLGTGHAVSMAHEALAGFSGTILVLYGDVPLIRPETIRALADAATPDTPLAVLGFRAADPTGYGRLLQDGKGRLTAIREEKDASAGEKRIDLCNSGFLAADAALLWRLLPQIKNTNAQGEYYLTDLVGLAAGEGLRVALVECPEGEVHGVNTRAQLAGVEAAFQQRYRDAAMTGGATLIAPETVFLNADTKLGRDVIIEPHVIFGPGVEIGDGVTILGFSHIEGARVAAGARIGPFARLRPGADIGAGAHIGNFVEIKQAAIAAGAKANHLAYIGDASVGAKSNIGAGTITCNYDGFDKHRTEIGADVFIGSNSALVAPVTIGDGANVAAGSVITRNVPADALAIARAEQSVREGWALKYREIKKAKRAKRR